MVCPDSLRGQSFSSRAMMAAEVFGPSPGASGTAFYSAGLTRSGTGLAMTGQRFFGTSLSYFEASAAIPLNAGGIGVVMSTLGSTAMSDHGLRISGAKTLAKHFALAVTGGFSSLVAKGYGSRASPLTGVGLAWDITDRCVWMIQAEGLNAFFSNSGDAGYTIRSGMGYRFSDQCTGSVQAMVNEFTGSLFLLSVDYLPAPAMGLRLACSNNQFMASATFIYSGIRFSVNSSWHMALGMSHGLSVGWSKKRSS